MTWIERAAPAKINLALHVTARRPDGLHELQSIVVFATTGDTVRARPATETGLTITGPFAQGLAGGRAGDNLILKAHARLCAALPASVSAMHFELRKNLPVASGIGGGSADAAAAMHAIMALAGQPLSAPDLARHGLALGADVPVCLTGRACLMSGIGEQVQVLDGFVPFSAVLVNPGTAVSTAQVFARLDITPGRPAFSGLGDLPAPGNGPAWLARLKSWRNDLQDTAINIAPQIGQVLAALEGTGGCQLARMSGSGATCFGLFASDDQAAAAAARISTDHPAWWVTATRLG